MNQEGAAYEKSFDTLSRNPAALTNADVVALGRFSAAQATEARRHLAARTPAPPTAQRRRDLTPGEEAAITERMKSATQRIGDALGKSIEKGDGEPFYDALWDAYASTHSRLEAGTVLLCAISHLAFFAVDINAKNQQRNARIKALEQQVAEQKTLTLADCYRGSWDGSVSYQRGDVVTRQGSLWLCQRDSVGTPPGSGGPETSGFVLVVKAGRDATR